MGCRYGGTLIFYAKMNNVRISGNDANIMSRKV